MRRSRWLLVLSFVVISSLLAWACGGGEEEEPSGPTAPAATSPAGETREAGETPTVEETPEAAEGDGEFSGLAEEFGKSTFKVTYELSGAGAGVTEGSMVWYKKGDNLRMDMAGEFEGEQTSAIFIMRSDKSYFCTDAAGMGEGGFCFETPGTEGEGIGDIATELENTLADPNVDIVSTSTRKIAGEDAKCYTVQSPDIEGESEICMSGEGVPLYSKSTVEGGEVIMEATDFSRDVSDGDFEPPYPISEEMPSLPEGQ